MVTNTARKCRKSVNIWWVMTRTRWLYFSWSVFGALCMSNSTWSAKRACECDAVFYRLGLNESLYNEISMTAFDIACYSIWGAGMKVCSVRISRVKHRCMHSACQMKRGTSVVRPSSVRHNLLVAAVTQPCRSVQHASIHARFHFHIDRQLLQQRQNVQLEHTQILPSAVILRECQSLQHPKPLLATI